MKNIKKVDVYMHIYKYDADDKYTDAQLELDSGKFENTRQEGFLALKNAEIAELKEALKPSVLPDPDINALVTILKDNDPNLKWGEDEGDEFNYENQEADDEINPPTVKKAKLKMTHQIKHTFATKKQQFM